MFDDGDAWFVKFCHQFKRRITVADIVVAEGLALDKPCRHHAGTRFAFGDAVEHGLLVRILAIAEGHFRIPGEAKLLAEGREFLGAPQPPRNHAVIGGGVGECRRRQFCAGCGGNSPPQFFNNSRVILWVGGDGDEIVILGGGANHGRPANIYIFNEAVAGALRVF